MLQLLQKVYKVQPLLDLLDGRRLRKLRQLAAHYVRNQGEDQESYSNFVEELELVIQ